ncbi:MAG: response regulator, partial [Candidatus Peribacteraceae bacterium]|nr:response regulator [Candidatus Peribacteraceae bacterium]
MTKESEELFKIGRQLRQSLRSSGYILFVDDDPSIAHVCTGLIESCGVEVKWVSSRCSAIEQIKEDYENIQCAVIDLHLCDGDGQDIVTLIETDFQSLPYIV